MVSLKGENPISGDNIDATSLSDWKRYGIGAFVVVAAVMAARGATDMVSKRLNIREQAEENLPGMT